MFVYVVYFNYRKERVIRPMKQTNEIIAYHNLNTFLSLVILEINYGVDDTIVVAFYDGDAISNKEEVVVDYDVWDGAVFTFHYKRYRLGDFIVL